MNTRLQEPTLSARAALAAALMAVDPVGLGGAALRGAPGPLRDAWLALLRQLAPEDTPFLRVPLSASDTALLGGLDLPATLHAARPVAQRGLLARADGGFLLLAMAERVGAGAASHLCAALDTHQVGLERDGLAQRSPARLAVVALDEGATDEERMPAALLDRLAFHLLLAPAADEDEAMAWTRHDIDTARERLPQVRVPDSVLQALCAASLAWGIDSLRAPLLALRAARAAAALAGLDAVDETNATLAASLVLAPRATRMPSAEPPASVAEEPQAEPPAEAASPETDDTPPSEPPSPPAHAERESEPTQEEPADQPQQPEQDPEQGQQALEDRLVDAVRAAIPAGLLAALQMGQARQARATAAGRSGAAVKHQNRGRPVGTRRGEQRSGARLHVLETLRAAAPWQRLRQQAAGGPARIQVRREDFHIVRYRQHRPTTTVFVVDASGSAALHRLAEAKGAVELLLAECYVRRDRVAVLAFRGAGTELLLPPTRSLARAKRSLSALPGGGGTPLASGLEAAAELAAQLARQGDTPIVVLLTDGRANIDRSGAPGRGPATEDALAAARSFQRGGVSALLIDTSQQPSEAAQVLAQAMGAAYVPLPHAGATGLSQAVQLASRPSR
jgi:magnesium chelatase subunit D